MEAVIEFFLGVPPEGSEPIYYVFRAAMGFILFDYLFDLFRFVRKLIL